MKKLDDTSPIEITPGLWWVGFADYEAGFSNNPYLLVDGDEAVLFDPGPGHPFFKYLILDKIEQVVPLEQVRYVVVHHQDPDLAALVPLIEEGLHPNVVVITAPRVALFLPYYGIRSPVLPVRDGECLELASGRRIRFLHLPYLHFAGNMASYDERSRTLFSSDIFGGFNRSWHLFADDGDLAAARDFLAEYVCSRAALEHAHRKLDELEIERICPQHGSVIVSQVDRFLDLLLEVEPGRALLSDFGPATDEQLALLTEKVHARLRGVLGREVAGTTIDQVVSSVMDEHPADLSLVLQLIATEAQRMGVADPLSGGRVHTRENIQPTSTQRVIDAVQRRLLTRQFALGPSDLPDLRQQGGRGLMSAKRELCLMFVDIRRFTKWCGGRGPDEIVKTLSEQLELEVRVIRAHGGRVNKVLGDGILAFFPAHNKEGCLRAAIEMVERTSREGMLPIGVGCSFGEVIIGDLGEESRLDFTLIGSAVNYAARLCDAAGGGEVCVDTRLAEKLDLEAWQDVVQRHPCESIVVKLKAHDAASTGLLLHVLGDASGTQEAR